MGNEARVFEIRVRSGSLKSGGSCGSSRLVLAAVLLPLGIVTLSRSLADDHAPPGSAAPPLSPLPPTKQAAAQVPTQIPTPPADAAAATVSDDNLPAPPVAANSLRLPPPAVPSTGELPSIVPPSAVPASTVSPPATPSTKFPSTDSPTITLPPPLQPLDPPATSRSGRTDGCCARFAPRRSGSAQQLGSSAACCFRFQSTSRHRQRFGDSGQRGPSGYCFSRGPARDRESIRRRSSRVAAAASRNGSIQGRSARRHHERRIDRTMGRGKAVAEKRRDDPTRLQR